MYTVEYLNNVIEGEKVLHLNVKMKIIERCIKHCIDTNQPVWFGCDVGQFFRSQSSILDKRIFNIEGSLGIKFDLNKRERIEYNDSLMTHAMLITGYNTDNEGNINRWQIENSWGTKGDSEGYLSMTHEWFKEYVYQIAIPINLLTNTEKQLLKNTNITVLPPWDPMGSLA